MRSKPFIVGLIASGLLACQGSLSLIAAERAVLSSSTQPTKSAQPSEETRSLAERILIAESKGDLAERSRLVIDLREGKEAEDVDALGLAIGGQLRDRKGWKSVEEVIEANRELPAIDRYERFRSGQPDTIQGHINVAQWCRKAGLDAQQAAHWHRVLQMDPNHQMARIALGHRRVNGAWISPEEVANIRQQVTALRASLQKHGKDLMKFCAEMMSDREARRDVATERFHAIEAADAIPAVSAIFATTPSPVIDEAVKWLSNMADPAAAEVLAQWSIDHPAEQVRTLCIEGLKRRSYYEYVPQLLDRTRSHVASAIIPSIRPDGSLAGVRHVFSREAKDNFDVTVVDTVNVRQLNVIRPDGDNFAPGVTGSENINSAIETARRQRQDQIRNALVDMQTRAVARRAAMQNERIAAVEDMTTEIVNDRVRLVLSRTSGTDSQAKLQDLWDWWSDYTEREPAPMKLASYQYRMNLLRSSVYESTAPVVEPPPVQSCECFVAGTPVITSRGEKPIDSLVVGDQVLSKNLATGELVWDVVVTTTRQPAKPLIALETDNDQFQCTGGHLFWVSGKGWTKARDLEDGDVLHGLTRPSLVVSVAEADAEPTYNLVTRRYHNYFVGEGKTLSHDFDEQTPTAIRVPGLNYTVAR